jgi:diguanylate cyclase
MERASLWAEQAMARIAAEGLLPTPPQFALWYTYHSQHEPDLNREIDHLSAIGKPLTPASLDALWERFIGFSRERQVVRDTGERIQGALEQLLDLLRSAGVDGNRYATALQQFSGRLDKPELEPLRSLVNVIATETKLVIQRNHALEARLQSTVTQMQELRRDLDGVRQEAVTDALTGLFNRRRFDAALHEAVSGGALTGQPVCLLMIDIDHFKKFNDSYGHSVGDHVLVLVARTIRECIGGTATAARYGGEEFAVILPNHGLTGALTVAERIRMATASKRVVNRSRNQTLGTITLSIGVAQIAPDELTSAFIDRADRALYAAKQDRRNRVVAENDTRTRTG